MNDSGYIYDRYDNESSSILKLIKLSRVLANIADIALLMLGKLQYAAVRAGDQ